MIRALSYFEGLYRETPMECLSVLLDFRENKIKINTKNRNIHLTRQGISSGFLYLILTCYCSLQRFLCLLNIQGKNLVVL